MRNFNVNITENQLYLYKLMKPLSFFFNLVFFEGSNCIKIVSIAIA